MFLVQNRATLGFMTDRDKLFVYFRCGFKSLLIAEHTIDLSGSNQSVHGFFMGRRTRQYCIIISMVSWTFYVVNFTFHVVNWTFYEVYWNFCVINY